MGYNNIRVTQSKANCICSICSKQINTGESVYIIPKKYISHIRCHKVKNDK